MPFIETIYSGSSGNCTLVAGDGGVLLVDMGKSTKQTLKLLYEQHIAGKDIKGILVTHEHSDHISGLKTFLNHFDVPVYGLKAVLNELIFKGVAGQGNDLREIEDKKQFELLGLGITPFRTPHDSVDCCGYRFDADTGAAAVATDLGTVTEQIYDQLRGCGTVILESNYDRGMLLTGPYPFQLKQRIMSSYGHLDNLDSSETIVKLVSEGTKNVVLAHLSDKNNTPSLARDTCRGMLDTYDLGGEVETASRYMPGRMIEF